MLILWMKSKNLRIVS